MSSVRSVASHRLYSPADPRTTTPSAPSEPQCSPDTLLQKVSNCYNSADRAPVTPPATIPEFPETPLPNPDLNPQQLLAAHTKPLTPQQSAAIDLLIAGRSDARAAAALGLHRVTVTRWRLYNHVFQAELNRRRQETWGAAGDRLRKALTRAVTVFRNQLLSDNDDLAFRAARALLHLAGNSRLVRPPDPAAAPSDPMDVLNVEARRIHIEQNSIDPRHDPLYDDDRALALRRLMHKNHLNPLDRDADAPPPASP